MLSRIFDEEKRESQDMYRQTRPELFAAICLDRRAPVVSRPLGRESFPRSFGANFDAHPEPVSLSINPFREEQVQ